ncbi:MAG: diacylglycerol kinase [bacterium]|nr:diacylglycerol kinase [bacterium]
MFNLKQFFRSFYYASRGVAVTWKAEQSFRVQVALALLIMVLMAVLRVKAWEAVALFLVIFSVLTLELLNSIIERIVDTLKPRISPFVEEIKDIMAAAVLLASIGALLVGLIILVPYFGF